MKKTLIMYLIGVISLQGENIWSDKDPKWVIPLEHKEIQKAPQEQTNKKPLKVYSNCIVENFAENLILEKYNQSFIVKISFIRQQNILWLFYFKLKICWPGIHICSSLAVCSLLRLPAIYPRSCFPKSSQVTPLGLALTCL